MAKYGIADYGVFAWYGGFFDNDDRLSIAKNIGFNGVERLYSHGADDTLMKAAQLKKLGMDFATCQDTNIEYSIKWTAALGGEYIWASVYADEMGDSLKPQFITTLEISLKSRKLLKRFLKNVQAFISF